MARPDYRRDGSRAFTELDFPPPAVLDVAALRRIWAPWFTLTASDEAPARALHAVHLLDMLAGRRDLVMPNLFSIVSPAGLRAQLARQARRDDLVAEGAEASPASGRWRELAGESARWWAQPAERQVVLVELLTQLGLHRRVVELVPVLRSTDSPRLAYEVARAGCELNRSSPVPLRVLRWVAEEATDPDLRVLAPLRLVSALSRARHDVDAAEHWLGVAEGRLVEVEPPWQAHLLRSRVHRAAALCRVVRRDAAGCAERMRLAAHHDALLAKAADDDLVRHYHVENRQLVLEASLKLATMTGVAHPDVADVRLVRPDADLLHVLGEYHEKRDEPVEACDAYLAAARHGSVRGAVAAYRAGCLLERLGRREDAAEAFQLCLDLDPASLSAAERRAA
ncbi:MAG: hypothetical protein HOY78_13700 [Saccharothrix sp.]|nr:hypothetical protein [Saccharothrix sp.]